MTNVIRESALQVRLACEIHKGRRWTLTKPWNTRLSIDEDLDDNEHNCEWEQPAKQQAFCPAPETHPAQHDNFETSR